MQHLPFLTAAAAILGRRLKFNVCEVKARRIASAFSRLIPGSVRLHAKTERAIATRTTRRAGAEHITECAR
jgi:hypothetical protein